MLPLFLVGPRRRLLTVTVVALVQVVTTAALLAERPGSIGADWSAVPYVFVLRSLATPLIGSDLASVLPTGWVIFIGVVAAVSASVLLWRGQRLTSAPGRSILLIVSLIVVIPMAGIAFGGESTSDLMSPWWAPRYFWPAGVGWAMLISLGLHSPVRAVAVPLLILFVVGATLEFRISPAPTVGWARLSTCIGGPTPCEIPVAPGENWTVRWQP